MPGTFDRDPESPLSPDDSAVSTGAARSATALPPSLPRTIGAYQIQAELGRGGMGVVYQAFHPVLKRVVALKVLLGGDCAGEKGFQRFAREAEATARLDHPHIVKILEYGEHNGCPFYTMPLLSGGSLARVLQDGQALPPGKAVEYMLGILPALAHAHGAGILHRDLKPANILLDEQGKPFLTDFGLAAWLDRDNSTVSRSGEICGTPVYMSPEQALGSRAEIGVRSDVYSLGALFYHLLAGQPPFPGGSWITQLYQVINADPPPLGEANPAIPRELVRVCERAMAKDPADRYPDVPEFEADLRRYQQGEPVHGRQEPWLRRWSRRLGRHRALALGAAVLLLLAAVLAGWWRWQPQPPTRWKLLLADDFGRAEMGAGYIPQSGHWQLAEGSLHGAGSGFVDLALALPAPGNVKVEVEASLPAGGGKREIALYLDHAEHRRAGYYFGLGGDYGVTAMDRAELEVALVDSPPLDAERWYAVELTRQGSRLRLRLDGEEQIDYQDPFPLDAAEMRRIRLGTYDGEVRFRRLRVYQETTPALISAVTVGDRLLENGQMDLARREYERIVQDHPGTRLADEARFKSGLCQMLTGHYEAAHVCWSEIESRGTAGLFRQLAPLNRAVTFRLQGRLGEARRELGRLVRQDSSPAGRFRQAAEFLQLAHACWRQGQATSAESLLDEVQRYFAGTVWAERAAQIKAHNAPTETGRQERLARFVDRYRRPGKPRHAGRQWLAGCRLLHGDEAGALAELQELVGEYAGLNRRFALDGVLGQATILTRQGRYAEALAKRDEIRRLFPADPLAEASIASLERDVLQHRAGWPALIRRLEEEDRAAPDDNPYSLLTLGLWYRQHGPLEAWRRIRDRLSSCQKPEIVRSLAMFQGDEPPEDFLTAESVPYPDRCRLAWLYYIHQGEFGKAVATRFHRETAPLGPDAADAILLARRRMPELALPAPPRKE